MSVCWGGGGCSRTVEGNPTSCCSGGGCECMVGQWQASFLCSGLLFFTHPYLHVGNAACMLCCVLWYLSRRCSSRGTPRTCGS